MKINLNKELEAIKREEEARAFERQSKAGIERPVKLDFKPELSRRREVYDASQRVWLAAHAGLPPGKIDPMMSQLWSMVNRGTSCLTEADFVVFSGLTVEQMRVLAPELVEGGTLAEGLSKRKWTSRTPDRGAKKSR